LIENSTIAESNSGYRVHNRCAGRSNDPHSNLGESMKVTERTTIRIHPEREVPEEAVGILSAGMVAHVGIVGGNQPLVIPLSYHYDP
jgi:hypothetical protein